MKSNFQTIHGSDEPSNYLSAISGGFLVPVAGLEPRFGGLIRRLVGESVVDLLWHLPVGIVDRRAKPSLGSLDPDWEGRIVTIGVLIEKHLPSMNARLPYRVRCTDGTGGIDLVYFRAKGNRLRWVLPVGAERIVSGAISYRDGRAQIAHPDHIVSPERAGTIPDVEPVYPLTTGLPAGVLAKSLESTLRRVPRLPEWIDPELCARFGWPDWHEAVRKAHTPRHDGDLSPSSPARQRLAYDEMLANQIAIARTRARFRRQSGRSLIGTGSLQTQAEAGFGFRLTGSQRQALAEIAGDLAAPIRMMRLLQGDVGSGKTVVALIAMLIAVESGAQAALMAPTEVLARQHHQVLQRLAAPAGVEIGLLTGREKGRARDSMLASLASGLTPVVVGTHALLQPDVAFRDLALAVIDEQHRFGVEQRLALPAKGHDADTLLMSATPIPRTLMMTAYGDLDVSRLVEKPTGRLPVDTRTVPLDRAKEVIEGIARVLDRRDAKVFWVCPVVEGTKASDVTTVKERFRTLNARFPNRAGIVHGRMKDTEKDRAMSAFVDGPIDLLVATTVVEIGVDVPAATVMVVEHAERFGLVQLHQMRGRVGRGCRPSTCILLYKPPLGEIARQRLRILRDTEDGFRIAEEDLRLRGGGEALGVLQSGLPEFRLADLHEHADLIAIAHDEARLILEDDPRLSSPRGRALRLLLRLFHRNGGVSSFN